MGQLVPYLMCATIIYGFYSVLGREVSNFRWFDPLLARRIDRVYRERFSWALEFLLSSSILLPFFAVGFIGTTDDSLYKRLMFIGSMMIVGGCFVMIAKIKALFGEMWTGAAIQSHPSVVGDFVSVHIESRGQATVAVYVDEKRWEFMTTEKELNDNLGEIEERDTNLRVKVFYEARENCAPKIVFIGWLGSKK